jgi:hypothetical protein
MARKLSSRDEGRLFVGNRSDGIQHRPAAELVFAGAVAAGFAVWVVSKATLSPDLVMPLVATAFFVLAATVALLAWRHRGMDPHRVTYRDVAGALTLIGVFAAAAIEPQQMVRLFASP